MVFDANLPALLVVFQGTQLRDTCETFVSSLISGLGKDVAEVPAEKVAGREVPSPSRGRNSRVRDASSPQTSQVFVTRHCCDAKAGLGSSTESRSFHYGYWELEFVQKVTISTKYYQANTNLFVCRNYVRVPISTCGRGINSTREASKLEDSEEPFCFKQAFGNPSALIFLRSTYEAERDASENADLAGGDFVGEGFAGSEKKDFVAMSPWLNSAECCSLSEADPSVLQMLGENADANRSSHNGGVDQNASSKEYCEVDFREMFRNSGFSASSYNCVEIRFLVAILPHCLESSQTSAKNILSQCDNLNAWCLDTGIELVAIAARDAFLEGIAGSKPSAGKNIPEGYMDFNTIDPDSTQPNCVDYEDNPKLLAGKVLLTDISTNILREFSKTQKSHQPLYAQRHTHLRNISQAPENSSHSAQTSSQHSLVATEVQKENTVLRREEESKQEWNEFITSVSCDTTSETDKNCLSSATMWDSEGLTRVIEALHSTLWPNCVRSKTRNFMESCDGKGSPVSNTFSVSTNTSEIKKEDPDDSIDFSKNFPIQSNRSEQNLCSEACLSELLPLRKESFKRNPEENPGQKFEANSIDTTDNSSKPVDHPSNPILPAKPEQHYDGDEDIARLMQTIQMVRQAGSQMSDFDRRKLASDTILKMASLFEEED